MKLTFDIDKYKRFFNFGKELDASDQRFILGVTALPSIGLIDYFMLSDKEKRNDSLSRTIAKIIIGTTTGVIIREGIFKLVEKFSKVEITSLKYNLTLIKRKSKINLFPDSFIGKMEGNAIFWEQVKSVNFRKALSTYLAIGVMLFTNFAVDMPLTTALTKFFRTHVFDSDKDKKVNIYETPKVKQAFSFASKRLNVSQVLKGEKK